MSWLFRWKTLRRLVQLAVIFTLLSPLFGYTFFKGTLISGELFGIKLTDPLAAIDFLLAAKAFYLSVIISALTVLGFYFLIGARTFCGWICPIYLLTELSRKLGKYLRVFKYQPKPTTRYWILAVVILLSVVTSRPVFEIVSPIGVISQNISMGIDRPQRGPDDGFASSTGLEAGLFEETLISDRTVTVRYLFNASLMLIIVILLVDIFISRAWWCRYVCPVGTFYTILGRFSPPKVKIKHDLCTDCGDCFDVCLPSEVLKDPVAGKTIWVNNSSCTNCLNCIDVCSFDALSLRLKFTKEKI